MSSSRVSASKSKAEFLRHLGLNDHDEEHVQVYREMMNEATEARHRICEDRSNLTPEARANPNLAEPYSSNMITESAMAREVKRVYASASPRTRVIYDLGRSRDSIDEDNWVIRWCLWHVFRYRDERNRNRGYSGSYFTFMDYGSDEQQQLVFYRRHYYSPQVKSASTYYDPIRDI